MKRKVLFVISLVLVSLMLLSLIGCGAAKEANPTTTTRSDENATTSAKSESTVVEAANGDLSPFGKYLTEINATCVLPFDLNTSQFPEGQDFKNNEWTMAAKKLLGINLSPIWSANSTESYNVKLDLMVSAGNVPDLFMAPPEIYRKLLDADQLSDLTSTWEQLSPINLALLDSFGPGIKESSKFNGKLMSFPATSSQKESQNLVVIRTDWLNKLNLPVPTTMEQWINTIKTFSDNDPDGNGKKDTYGMAFSKLLPESSFFNGFGAYKGIWIKDKDGKTVCGDIQPEMKQALQALAELYKAGAIDPEFTAKDWLKELELINSGKIGSFTGGSNAFYLGGYDLDKKLLWDVIDIPSATGARAKPQVTPGNYGYFVVRKGYEHPEALVKLLNLASEVINKPFGTTSVGFPNDAETLDKCNMWKASDGKSQIYMAQYAPFRFIKTDGNM
ncbi:MAG: hypothetical protein A2Y21_11770, partial [Clostridiales bacterium GWC2_40_7]